MGELDGDQCAYQGRNRSGEEEGSVGRYKLVIPVQLPWGRGAAGTEVGSTFPS